MDFFQGDTSVLQLIGKYAYYIYCKRELGTMYLHLMFSALLPIYAGSHSSLRCPPSAKAPTEDKDGVKIEVAPPVEGLQPSDAIVFPVLAGCVLGGLYYVIKWLEDPALLNKILGYYFSAIGTVGVGTLTGDSLNVFLSLAFPSILKYLRKRFVLRLYITRIVSLRHTFRLQSIIGLFIGILTIAGYNLLSRPWWLTNIIAWGFCYGTLQVMSPTTFWTGSLVLAGLFVYDITMVFFTPLMMTVATSLDVPIKLVFPGPGRGSMLGLGDVVLPGIMIGLALRFDLYLNYLWKGVEALDGKAVKPLYIEATGGWGSSFSKLDNGTSFKKVYFTASMVCHPSILLGASPAEETKSPQIGYIIGMIATLIVLNISKHGQPALLYLVPGVLIALWGTAFVRGDLARMWEYTEDGSLTGDNEKTKKDSEKKTDNEEKSTPEKNIVQNGDVKKATKIEKGKIEDGIDAQEIFHLSLSQPSKDKALSRPLGRP
ncbi:signal peptide peptidase-domain-containing protein [Calycina marina]|uniref:Signal peptide peptidase-domain-containing protein n=1 Tax=Calycina marina TaxID=1763456 RepID=A0A9P8CCR1_9HELO|nr:signal peptide peptidase-domain-containing protein [Calycina marina]